MKPHVKLAETKTPDGGRLTLHEHDGAYTVRLNGQALMDSTVATSELQIGELATDRFPRFGKSRVLIGGLGLGFTLRSALDGVGPHGVVELAELMPAIVEWNRTHLAKLNGALVDDKRVQLHVADVWAVLSRAGSARYDAIILDTDNGPSAMVQRQNARLYDDAGLKRIAAALKPTGRAVIWSASHDRAFAARLTKAGFKVEVLAAKVHATAKRPAYTLYVADKVVVAAP
ncbi:MAG: spermine synthase [Verrucomicrobia bacterium]|nr:spermine synthase [Verrucomicrobiota bacterium]